MGIVCLSAPPHFLGLPTLFKLMFNALEPGSGCLQGTVDESTQSNGPQLLSQRVKEGWFASSSAFQKHVMYGKLDTGDLDDSQSLRAACVYMHFGWLRTWKCSKRKFSTMLQQGRSVTELLWLCSRNQSHKHFRKSAEVPVLPF